MTNVKTYEVLGKGEEADVIGFAATAEEAEAVFARYVLKTTGKAEMPPVFLLRKNRLGQAYFEPAE